MLTDTIVLLNLTNAWIKSREADPIENIPGTIQRLNTK